MAVVRDILGPENPTIMFAETTALLEAMTEDDIAAAAESDQDNPPLTDQEITCIRTIRIARTARMRTGLTPATFAGAFAVNLSRLWDIEQGRKTPDRVLISFLALVADAPDRAHRVLAEGF